MSHAVKDLPSVDAVVEIGGGTGAITEYLQDFNPTVIEIDEAFANLLKRRFPHLDVHHGCGLQYIRSLESEAGLVISVPLINNPIKHQFIKAIKDGHQKGQIKWCVIFTYGFSSPLREAGFAHACRRKLVVANVPPAHVWVYF